MRQSKRIGWHINFHYGGDLVRMSIIMEKKQIGAEKDYFENTHWVLEQMGKK